MLVVEAQRSCSKHVPVVPRASLDCDYPLSFLDHHHGDGQLQNVSWFKIEATRRRTFVHGDTANSWADVEPAAAASLAELAVLVVNVASNADGRAGILADSPDLTALQANLDVLSSHNLGAVVPGFFILVHYSGRGASTAAKDCTTRGG